MLQVLHLFQFYLALLFYQGGLKDVSELDAGLAEEVVAYHVLPALDKLVAMLAMAR
jgi:hypothetical protein